MAQVCVFFCSYLNIYYYKFLCSLVSLVLLSSVRASHGFGTFGFDIHHRYSDPVKGILAVDELPAKGSFQYFSAMANRDRVIHGRRLATADGSAPLTFSYGNETYRIDSLGYLLEDQEENVWRVEDLGLVFPLFGCEKIVENWVTTDMLVSSSPNLHYANISIGTPSSWFLVALDTGSDLLWLPCDCSSCAHGFETAFGKQLELNIYSPNMSSTSQNILCNSNLCSLQYRCTSAQSNCPYQIAYLSNGTSSNGVLVEDVLHLVTDDTQAKAVDAKVSFGCGQVQTGSFLDGAAPNGLFGLGMSNISIPSTLAREGYISNSFSMCFGADGLGRITFGDKGSSDQGETPFILHQSHRTYNISATQIIVGGNAADLDFYAIFDSGTSFTYLNDPAYTLITESFNNLVKDTRASVSDIPFEYCYNISPNQNDLLIPQVNLVMKGGDQFNATNPIVIVGSQGGASVYCLGVVKSGDINIIGQNFMTGYRVVFDRERNVLGWKPSNCYDDDVNSNTMPIGPTVSSVPPATAVNPEATAGIGNNSHVSGMRTPAGNHIHQLSPLTRMFITILVPFFAIF